MATSYNLTLKLPTTSTFLNAQYNSFFQFSAGGGGPYASVALCLDDIKTTFENQFGGTFTYASATVGAYTEYYISYDGLTSDPETSGTGDLISILIQDDVGTAFSARFKPVATVTTTQCDTCYEIMKSACEDSYVFALDLEAGTDYTVAFIANNGNTYIQTVTADGSGQLTIDATATDFPSGFFTPDTGGYTVKIYTDIDLETVVPFIIGSNEYTCIQLSFQYITTTTSSIQVNFEYLIHDENDGSGDYFIVDDIGNTFIVG